MKTDFANVAELNEHYKQVKRRLPPPERKLPPPTVQESPEAPPPPPAEPDPPPYRPMYLPPIQRLGRLVCAYYNFPWERMISPVRETDTLKPRFVTCYIAHALMHVSLPRIGDVINRDHSSVLHGYRKIKEQLETDEDLAREVLDIWMQYEAMQ